MILEDEEHLQEIEERDRQEYERDMESLLSGKYNFVSTTDNFISKYMKYASALTDSPEEFHFLAAVSILSVVSDRKAYVQFEYGKMYLNTFLQAVAPPSARKSTGFEIYTDILKQTGFKDILLPTKSTPETLTRMLSENSHRVYTSDEYSIFLKDAKEKKYNDGILNDIVKFYDSPDNYTIGRGGSSPRMDDFGNKIETNIEISNVFLNQLVFIQDRAYKEHVTEYEFGIGFPQRFNSAFCSVTKKRPRQSQKRISTTIRASIVQYVETLKRNLSPCEIIYTDELHNFIFENVEVYYDSLLKDDALLQNFPSRFADQIYKLSSLLALDEVCSQGKTTGKITVTIGNITQAINYLKSMCFDSTIEHIRNAGTEKMRNYSDFDKAMSIAKKNITKAGGKLPKKDLTPLLHLIGNDLRTFYTQALAEEKLIFTDETNPKTKKSNQYVSLPK